jgi:hypothetical protein
MIFLDLRRSRYIGIGGTQLPALCAALLGRSDIEGDREDASTFALSDEWLRRLHGQRLLSEATTFPSRRERPQPIEPIASLTTDDDERALGSEWTHLFRLWHATLVASTWLRGYSLAGIADCIAALRASRSRQGNDLTATAMHAEAARYMRLRLFALTTHDQCLKDSLTLIRFLASRRLFPRWVIGVRVHPFGAHSWVQSGAVVLNDLPERVRQYQPILIV